MKQEIIVHRSAEAVLFQTALEGVLLDRLSAIVLKIALFSALSPVRMRDKSSPKGTTNTHMEAFLNLPVMLGCFQNGGCGGGEGADLVGGVVGDMRTQDGAQTIHYTVDRSN